jgi:hypothetical protein
MWLSLACFFVGFFIQGILIAFIWNWFKSVSEKRRQRKITEREKWQQAIVSIPAKPILEAILRKDPIGMRVLYSISLANSTIFSVLLSSGYFIIILSLLVLACIWLSL